MPASSVGTCPVVRIDEDGGALVEREPSLFVYCDYEAVTDERVQTPILLCLEDAESNNTHSFHGTNCTEEMFNHLEEVAVDVDGDDQRVIMVFHNFIGYDGMFVLQYLYKHHREFKDQITMCSKILSLKSDNLTFKDLVCFLPFPLANFPATFGLTELRKGSFPHFFNTLANQDYQGPMPPADIYDPDGMSTKK